jgi:hypothetical protein
MAPPAHRKDVRAKLAKGIINKSIPEIISRNARAAAGVRESRLYVDPPPTLQQGATGINSHEHVKKEGKGKSKTKGKGKGKRKDVDSDLDEDIPDQASKSLAQTPNPPSKPLRIRILPTDTLTAALHISPRSKPKSPTPHSNTTLLNMASPLRPGGGVLTGATSQEEFLCARTTLLPSLHERFYRLPSIGGVLTKDVLVFRGPGALDTPELPKEERWWVDVVSAGTLRFPDIMADEEGVRRYASEKDRAQVRWMMRAVMRLCVMAGRKRVVLGAWGCGAYGNPVMEVARAWREVLLEGGESWEPVEEVVFGILEGKMAGEFAGWFGEGLEVEEMPGSGKKKGGGEEQEEVDEEKDREELKSKIEEMEGRIERVNIPALEDTLNVVLEGMKKQLADREGTPGVHLLR